MIINLNKFLASDEKFFNVNRDFIIDDEEFLARTHLNNTIVFNGDFFKVDDNILLSGTLKYNYSEVCARCLTEFQNEVETKFEAIVVRNNEEDEDESDEIKLVIEDGCVNLDDNIKQLVYLSMPMKSLCKDDCKGICPTCGVNLNEEECKCQNIITDPRLEKLKTLLKD
ncbi:MAG: DUF177 domain-containing protein [Tissierellia bacterium]|nr:DUF177 domain-containing protein [Tissierellia bacterium]MDD4780830.1 DUF177 domain-containing protein [Tissierellia bacterium]